MSGLRSEQRVVIGKVLGRVVSVKVELGNSYKWINKVNLKTRMNPVVKNEPTTNCY